MGPMTNKKRSQSESMKTALYPNQVRNWGLSAPGLDLATTLTTGHFNDHFTLFILIQVPRGQVYLISPASLTSDLCPTQRMCLISTCWMNKCSPQNMEVQWHPWPTQGPMWPAVSWESDDIGHTTLHIHRHAPCIPLILEE